MLNIKASVTSVICLFNLLPATADSAVIFFDNRASFEAAAPGLAVETFQEARLDLQPRRYPLDSTTNDGNFAPGEILQGIQFSGGERYSTVFPGGSFGNPGSISLGSTLFTDDIAIRFTTGVDAVGFDIVALRNPGTTTISVFDTANNLLDSLVINLDNTFSFVGAISDSPLIGRITTGSSNPNDLAELIDNVAFRIASVPEPATVALFSLALAGLGFCRRKRIAS